MFAGSQRFESGFCSGCNKKMLLLRRGLGYEWRCKECGAECEPENKMGCLGWDVVIFVVLVILSIL